MQDEYLVKGAQALDPAMQLCTVYRSGFNAEAALKHPLFISPAACNLVTRSRGFFMRLCLF